MDVGLLFGAEASEHGREYSLSEIQGLMVAGQLYSHPVVACQVAMAVLVQLAGSGARVVAGLGRAEVFDGTVVVVVEDSWRG